MGRRGVARRLLLLAAVGTSRGGPASTGRLRGFFFFRGGIPCSRGASGFETSGSGPGTSLPRRSFRQELHFLSRRLKKREAASLARSRSGDTGRASRGASGGRRGSGGPDYPIPDPSPPSRAAGARQIAHFGVQDAAARFSQLESGMNRVRLSAFWNEIIIYWRTDKVPKSTRTGWVQ